MRRKTRVTFGFIVATAVLTLAGALGGAGAGAAGAAPAPRRQKPDEGSRLSSRLHLLSTPALRVASAAERARRLSLAADGPGALVRLEGGDEGLWEEPRGTTAGGAGLTDEGRAMSQIVHDLAPGARLAFATANGGVTTMADNIRSLRNAHGSSVIVDDVTYFVEPMFQDGPVSVAVNDVTATGA